VERPVVLNVFRWSPDAGERVDRFEVEAGPATTVLDALVDVQRRLDQTLAFRYACRNGMCGSCGMVIDGRERWACRTLLRTLHTESITVRPMYHHPLIRDLVVDMAPFRERMVAARAAFVPAEGAPEYARIPGEGIERRRIDATIECIGCGLCLSACSIVGHDPRFPGPAPLNRAYTLQMDSRDAAREERLQLLSSDDTLARCHAQANCTAVCPMQLEPAGSILALRRRAVRALFG
jgi:fumarate reductase iron-sulfur subunit